MDQTVSPSRKIKSCCVPGCKDRTSIRHRFPLNDPERFNIWRQNIGNPKLSKMTNEQIYKVLMVCRSHFISKFHVPGTKMLHRKAIPTEHLPSPPEFTSIPEMIPVDISQFNPPRCPPSKIVKGFPNIKYTSMQIKQAENKIAKKPLDDSELVEEVPRQACAVPGCRPKESGRFRFPHPRNGKERFEKWLEKIRNPALNSISPELIYKNGRLCGRHFEPEYFFRPNTLKYSAIPTLFVPDPDEANDSEYSESTQQNSPEMIINNEDTVGTEDEQEDRIASSPQPSIDIRCRICLTMTENGIPLSHSTNIDGEDSRTLCEILNKCCKVEISIDDNKPQSICIECVEKARAAYEFSKCCDNSELILQNELAENDEADSDTILCYMDVSDFEKIEEKLNTPSSRKEIIETNEECDLDKSKIYAKCDESVKFRLQNVKTKQNLIISKECACRHNGETSNYVGTLQRFTKSTICVHCRRNFSKHARFKWYSNVLIGKKRFCCVKCGARFASPRNLNLHLVVHKDILRYTTRNLKPGLNYSKLRYCF